MSNHSRFTIQAEGTTGYDALLQTADGRPMEVEIGYERPASGPTTNFVGNHMTQVDVPELSAVISPAGAYDT